MNTTKTDVQLNIPHFVVKDCALIAIATHKRANTLKEFRDHIENLSPDSLYYHFWADLLLPHFEEREYINDFASWIRHSLHDSKLAEQLAMIDPMQFSDLEILRFNLLEHIDDRLDESEYLQWLPASQHFEFIRSQIVVFDTHLELAAPREMSTLIPTMSISSIFYHFIDARSRTVHKIDDFREWLALFGDAYQPLIDRLSDIDPYFISLVEIREHLTHAFHHFFMENAL